MKRFILILLILVSAPAFAAGGFLKSVDEARKLARQKNQLIFVDLFADWCGWCHRFDREVVPAEKFQKAMKDKVLLRVDTEDGKEGTQLARDFAITNLPTFLLLTPDFTIAGIIRGYAPAAQFVQELEKIEKEYRDFQKRVANEASIAEDGQKRLELAKELYTRHAFADSESRLKKLLTMKKLSDAVRDDAYLTLAVVQVSQKDYAHAIGTLNNLLDARKNGEPAEQARYFLARVYMDQKNYPAALGELKRFKVLFPQSRLGPSVDFLIPHVENLIARAQ